jgi:hypothetical protein
MNLFETPDAELPISMPHQFYNHHIANLHIRHVSQSESYRRSYSLQMITLGYRVEYSAICPVEAGCRNLKGTTLAFLLRRPANASARFLGQLDAYIQALHEVGYKCSRRPSVHHAGGKP